jgi:hypothetical protein
MHYVSVANMLNFFLLCHGFFHGTITFFATLPRRRIFCNIFSSRQVGHNLQIENFYVIASLEHVFMFLNVIADVNGKTVLDKKIDDSRIYVDTSLHFTLHIG